MKWLLAAGVDPDAVGSEALEEIGQCSSPAHVPHVHDRDPTFLSQSAALTIARSFARSSKPGRTKVGHLAFDRSAQQFSSLQHAQETAGGFRLRARRGGAAGRHPRCRPRLRRSAPR